MSSLFAILAYVFSIPGALIVYIVRRNDPFSVYHARQALAIGLAGLAAPLAWMIISWLLIWVPTLGLVIALSLFALVLAAIVALVIATLFGMLNALTGITKPVPFVGEWADRNLPLHSSALPNQTSTTHSERTNSDA